MPTHQCAKRASAQCEQVSLGTFIDRSEKFGQIEVYQCVHCKHAVSRPPIPDVSFLYEDRNSQDYQPDARNRLSKFIKNLAFRIQAKALLRDMGQVQGCLLDFGCGSGQFTRVLSKAAENLEVTGCDFFTAPPAELATLSYLSHREVAQSPEAYDGVIAMHVLEHDDDPDKLLRSITAPVKAGGLVVVEVPNVECVWSAIFGRYWDAWYVPFHRHHFSRPSLEQALTAGGLEVMRISGVTAPTMGRTVANLFGARNHLLWLLVGIALHPVQLIGEVLTGRRTALRAICRKPDGTSEIGGIA